MTSYRDRFGMRHGVLPWHGGWVESEQKPADRAQTPLDWSPIYPTKQDAEEKLAYWAGVYQWKEEN